MKKSLSIIASVALCFAFGAAAFAEEPVVLSNEEDVMLISAEEPEIEEVEEVDAIAEAPEEEAEEAEELEEVEEEVEEEMSEEELIAYEAQVNEDKFIVIMVVAISVAAIVAFNIIGNNLCIRKKR